MRLFVFSLMLVLLISTPINRVSAQYRTTNNSSTLEINNIDIAPTNTPKPSPRSAEPSQPMPTAIKQPQTTDLPKKPQAFKAPKRFFSLHLTQDSIDFGTIDPTNPVIRTNMIALDRGNAFGMSLFAYENKPLTATSGAFIPDTTCDDGSCTQILSGIWENTLTYGFGYRCDDQQTTDSVCSLGFSDKQTYRQFAEVARNEASAQVLAGTLSEQTVRTNITYKLNIPGTQEQGHYTNALMLIAAPTY